MHKGISEHLLCARPCRDLGAGLSGSCPVGIYDRQGEVLVSSLACPRPEVWQGIGGGAEGQMASTPGLGWCGKASA